jgi:hypothetical protein
MIFGQVKRNSTNASHIKDIGQRLIVLCCLRIDLSETRGQMGFIEIKTKDWHFFCLIEEVFIGKSLHLDDEGGQVVSLELIRGKHFASSSMIVYILCPGRLPLSNSTITVKGGISIHEISMAIYFLDLISVAKVVLASLK